ncbi:MAG: C2H2-type zinc finger protein [Nitrososphaerota archaeon]
MRTILVKLVGLEPLSTTIAYELSDLLSEKGGFALPREHDVVVDLSLMLDSDLSVPQLVRWLENILDRLGLEGGYSVELAQDSIMIRATSEERVARVAAALKRPSVSVETCPHCGFTTPYPEIMREHIKIHYLL